MDHHPDRNPDDKVSEEQFKRVNSFLESGQAEGATALAGGGVFSSVVQWLMLRYTVDSSDDRFIMRLPRSVARKRWTRFSRTWVIRLLTD